MSRSDMQIPKSEKTISWPPPLPNPGDAPVMSQARIRGPLPQTKTYVMQQMQYTNLHIRVDQSENVIFNRSANHNTLNITRVKDTCKCVVNKPKLT